MENKQKFCSCRLAVNHETGRIRWCVGQEQEWQTKLKKLVFLPVILLPLVIVIIVLSRYAIVPSKDVANVVPLENYKIPKAPPKNPRVRIVSYGGEIYAPKYKHYINETEENIKRQRRNAMNQLKEEGTMENDFFLDTYHLESEESFLPYFENENNEKNYSELTLETEYLLENYRNFKNSIKNRQAKIVVLRNSYNFKKYLAENSQETLSSSNAFLRRIKRNVANKEKSYISHKESPKNFQKNFEYKNKESKEDEAMVNLEIFAQTGEANEKPFFWDNSKNLTEIRKLQSRIMLRYINPNIDPCKNFYEFSCGNWKQYYKIPSDRVTYDTFEIVRENMDILLKDLLEEVQHEPVNTTEHKSFKQSYLDNHIVGPTKYFDIIPATVKAKLYYTSCMQEEVIANRGTEPLKRMLDELGGWPIISPIWNESNFDLVWLLAQLRTLNNDVLIQQWIGPDMKDSDRYVVHIDQTSLGLPSSDYYLDSSYLKFLRAYKVFILTTARLMGEHVEVSEQDVEDMVEFETKIASIMASMTERRNISEYYLRTDISSLQLYFPQFAWSRYFELIFGRKFDYSSPVACYCAKYLHKLFHLTNVTPPRVIQNYVIWRFVRHRLNNLDNRFMRIKQRFYYILIGRESNPPRTQYCVTQVNANMGMAIGALFVLKYFDKISRTDTITMTKSLIDAFKDTLDENTWLDENTKQFAQMKINKMDLNIGFPDYILNEEDLTARYSDVEIHPDYYLENSVSILKHLVRLEILKLGTRVNRSQWNTPPAVVNAYYSRNKNQIIFPAGMLQPPFYHRHFPKALNFGGIGVVIGHEITHGFDDKGRLFDHHGNFHLWWKEPSILRFYEKSQCLIDQYSSYVLPDIKQKLNGHLTQGENIADNGGLKQSYKAYESWLENNPESDETLPGLNFTARQLFFLNFAQVWCGDQRKEASKGRIKTSAHAPGVFRVIGVLSNSKEFSEAFSCPLDSPMNPVNKCIVW